MKELSRIFMKPRVHGIGYNRIPSDDHCCHGNDNCSLIQEKFTSEGANGVTKTKFLGRD